MLDYFSCVFYDALWHAAEFGFDAAMAGAHTTVVGERRVILIGDGAVVTDSFEREIGAGGGLLGCGWSGSSGF